MMTLKIAAQAGLLKSTANIIAQLAARWHQSSPQPFDWQRVLEFAIFGLIQAHVGYAWQEFLEDVFPTRPPTTKKTPAASTASPENSPGISWVNVACKLLVDQTIGLVMMNSVFLICTNAMRLQSPTLVLAAVWEKIFGVIMSAWKVWPLFALVNFLWVPLEKRVLVGSIVAFCWNIFLAFSLMAK